MLRIFHRSCLNNSLLNTSNKQSLAGAVKLSSSCPQNILNHFLQNGQVENLKLFPSEWKRITSKKETELYVADQDAAKVIAKTISRFHVKNVPFFEINPGPCILSKALLHYINPKKLGLIEKNDNFAHFQKSMAQSHKSKVLLSSMKDRWTHYMSMVSFILEHSDKKQWHEDVICQIFVYLQTDNYFRIVTDIIKQRRLFTNGRIDIFAILPSIEYMKLTANPESTYLLYTQRSCIFQILFDYELLGEFQKESFLPWYNQKSAYGGRIEHNTDLFYFVRMTPKRDLLSICPPDDLPPLRFFIQQCLFKRSAYIIPKLEQWFPGIGVNLITSKFDQFFDTEPNGINLIHHLKDTFHTFSKCGSLTPLQFCALFQFFRKSPHYKSSCFHQQYKDFYILKSSKSTIQSDASDDEIDSAVDKKI